MTEGRHDIALHVNGQLYRGWKAVSVRTSMADLCGEFELAAANPWTADGGEIYPVSEFDACKVSIDGETVIDGYIDDVEPSLDPQDHPLTIRGRDRAADIVDCSAVHPSGRWSGVNLLSLARDLAWPFGISVAAETDIGKPFAAFVIQQGETAYSAIERAARMRGVLIRSDGAGGIVITRAQKGRPVAHLVEGDPILSFRAPRSARERFYRYIVKGQSQEGAWGDAATAASTKATAFDLDVPRKARALVVIAEDLGDGVTFAQRAQFEAAARRGKALTLMVRTKSWRRADGGLWRAGDIVTVDCPRMRHRGARIIEAVTLSLDDKGWQAELTLKPPEAWDRLPEKESKEDAAWT